jgi:hypothetical protein
VFVLTLLDKEELWMEREQKAREGVNPQTRERKGYRPRRCPPSALGRGSSRLSKRASELRCKRKANNWVGILSWGPALVFGAPSAAKVHPRCQEHVVEEGG